MRSNKEFPNLYIVGAPKCGTTALHGYLSTHPDILMSKIKEPHYFSTDLERGGVRLDLKQYKSLFSCTNPPLIRGESSTGYLYSQTAIPNILKVQPNAKFIVMLREPTSMFISLFHQRKFRLAETLDDPEDAWRMQDRRARGENIPAMCIEPKQLQYREWCNFGEQVYRLLKFVNKSQVKFIFLEDIKRDSRGTYLEILKFLEVEDDGRTDFAHINPRTENRSKLLMVILYYMGSIKNKLGFKFRLGALEVIQKLTQKKIPPATISDAFKKELKASFRDDIQNLEKLIERDLSHWYL